MSKESYKYYKMIGRCPICKVENVTNLVYCRDCLEYNRQFKHSKKYKENNKIYRAKRRKMLIDRGICVRCAKRKAREGKQTCKICSLRYTKKHNRKREQYELLGVCMVCGKYERKENKRVCEICYSKISKNFNTLEP